VVPALVEWPALLSLALAAWVGGCLFLSLLRPSPRSYVLMLAGYTATIIAFPSVNRPETIFDIASARMTEIMLGICATVVQPVLADVVAERLGPRLSTWLADAEIWLRDAMHGTPRPKRTAAGWRWTRWIACCCPPMCPTTPRTGADPPHGAGAATGCCCCCR
jgi:uncharacterized membrane protein YccC